MSDFIFHTGLSKTGTSTLQRSVFQHHSQIHYLGKYVPSKITKGCRSQQAYDILAPLLWQLEDTIEVEEFQRRFRSMLEQPDAREKTVVGSWEALGAAKTGDFILRMERLMAVCGNVKLLVTLRNPLSWLPSLYLQQVQGQFLKTKRPLFEDRCFLEFDEWMRRHEVKSRGLSNWLCYATNIRQAVQLVGQDRVCVLLFEDLVDNPDAYYAQVARFMNIDTQQTVELARGTHHNKRLLRSELDYIREVNSSVLKRFKWSHSSHRTRRRQLASCGHADDQVNVPARVTLSDQQRDNIARGTADGHRWLVEQFGLRLEHYGYPL